MITAMSILEECAREIKPYWDAQAQFGPFDVGPIEFLVIEFKRQRDVLMAAMKEIETGGNAAWLRMPMGNVNQAAFAAAAFHRIAAEAIQAVATHPRAEWQRADGQEPEVEERRR